MPEYRRARVDGGTYFFTLVVEGREDLLCRPAAKRILRQAIARCRATRPFSLQAIVLLPDHLHMLWSLPPGDHDFSSRIAAIKAIFTRDWLALGGEESSRSDSRLRRGARGVWQRRFWEHLIRDETDLANHLDYIHYNPVKHGLATCPHAWPYSSFRQWVKKDAYASDWLCACHGGPANPPLFPADTSIGGE